MQTEVMFAGFGGQGILLCAKVLAQAAMNQGRQVVWIPSYGPEMRGGTAYCMVVISDRQIGSPIIRHPSHLVAMNRPSLEKFGPLVKPGGVVLVNSTLIPDRLGRDDVDELRVAVNDIAISIGSIKSANIVALGAFCARSGLVAPDVLEAAVRKEFSKKPKLVPMNIQALAAGGAAAQSAAVGAAS